MQSEQELLESAYAAFNDRQIDAALATMHGDVEWPNGWEGGYVFGHDAVREYWTRQWAEIDPHVEPVAFETDASGRVVVTVHAIVRDTAGTVVSEGTIEHVYTIDDGLVRRMEIRQP